MAESICGWAAPGRHHFDDALGPRNALLCLLGTVAVLLLPSPYEDPVLFKSLTSSDLASTFPALFPF